MGDLDIWETNAPSLRPRSLWAYRWFVFDEVLSNGAVVASRVDLGEEIPVIRDTGAPKTRSTHRVGLYRAPSGTACR